MVDFNLGRGLAAMGGAIDKMAGDTMLEQQRAELQKQATILANDLATERESRGRQETHALNLETLGKQQEFQAGESKADRENRLATANISAGASIAVANSQRQTQLELQRMKDALPPEAARLAKALAELPQEHKDALWQYQEMLKGPRVEKLPEWEKDPDNPGAQRPVKGGPQDPDTIKRNADAKRAENEKAIPPSVTKGMQENVDALKQIDRTLAALEKTPGSVGGVGSMAASVIPGMSTLQNTSWGDPAGTSLRALIADIGSLKIHDRSGAAVSASEFPRLKPFIPAISDDAKTVRDKLANFRATYESALFDASSYYSRENGFKPYTPADDYLSGRSTETSKPKSEEPPGPVTAQPGTYKGPDGKPVKWADIEKTAKNRGISVDDVVNRLGLKPLGTK